MNQKKTGLIEAIRMFENEGRRENMREARGEKNGGECDIRKESKERGRTKCRDSGFRKWTEQHGFSGGWFQEVGGEIQATLRG